MAGSFNSEFSIHKKEGFGLIKKLFNNSNSFRGLKEYVINDLDKSEALIEKLYQALEPLFKSGEIYSIILEKDILTISLRSEKHHFDIFEELFEF